MRKFLRFTLMLLATFMVTLNARAWTFTLQSPEAGDVSSIPSIKLGLPFGWLFEIGTVEVNITDEKGNTYPCCLANQNPEELATDFRFSGISDPGTYTLTIPANTVHQPGASWDVMGEGNEEFSVSWTVVNQQQGGEEQGGNTEQEMGDYTFKYDKENGLLTLTWSSDTHVGPTYLGGYYLDGYSGDFNLNPYDANYDFFFYEQLRANVDLPDGDYKLVILAGTYKINDVENPLIEIPFTVGSSQGGGTTTVELTGESFEFFNISEIKFADYTEKNNGKDIGTFEKYGFSLTGSKGSSTFIPKFNYNSMFKGLVGYAGNNITINSTSHPILGVEFILTEGEKNITVTEGVYADGKWQAPATHAVTSATFSFKDRAVIEKIIIYTDEDVTTSTSEPEEMPQFVLNYDKAESALTLTWPEGNYVALGTAAVTLEGYSGAFDLFENEENSLIAYLDLPNGNYTLNIPENAISVNGVPMAATTYPFTVNSSVSGDGWNETIFSSSTWASKGEAPNPIVINTNGVQMTTVGTMFNGEDMNVGFDIYDTKELNWKTNTKLVFIPQGDNTITKIILVPTDDAKSAIGNASASLGTYDNGTWTGELNATASLTLTANEGINLAKIIVCYNGNDGQGAAGDDDVKGTIIINWPENNHVLDYVPYGGKFVTFTTNKEYAQVTVELKNNDTRWRKDDLPVRMVDNAGEKSDNLHVGENTIYITTPGEKSWYPYKEDSYTLVVKGYVHMWDAPEDYDAVAEVNIIGNGINHPPVSDYKLISFSPITATDLNPFETRNKLTTTRDNIITLEFDGPVASVTALTPGGFSGVDTKYETAKANAEGTLWNITVPGDAIEDSEDGNAGSLTIDVTAADANGAAIAFNYDRADFGISLMYDATREDVTEEDIKSLGTPAFSIVSGTLTVDPSIESILMTFPHANGFDGNMKVTVKGTFSCMDQSQPVAVNASGTMGQGIVIPVELTADNGYNLEITEIEMTETVTNDSGIQSEVVVSSFKGNWATYFATGGSDIGGGTDYGILGEPVFTADTEGVTISWPNADLSGIDDCGVEFTGGILVTASTGEEMPAYPEISITANNTVEAKFLYSKVFDSNIMPYQFSNGEQITVTIPAQGIVVYTNYSDYFGSKSVYENDQAIIGTVTAVIESGNESETHDNILGDAVFTADVDGITVSWPDAKIADIPGGAVSFGEWTLTHKGVNYPLNPELTYELNNFKVQIPYTKIAVWDDTIGEWGEYVPATIANGDEIVITIPKEGILVWENYDDWGPTVYSNESNIVGTVNAVVGESSGDTQTETTLAFANETATVAAGETLQLTATSNVPNAPIVYSSSDDAIATVDAETGLVTAVAAGNVTITAYIAETVNYTEATAFCDVTVTSAQTLALVESYPAANQKMKNLYGETFKFVFNEPVKRVQFTVVDNTTGEGVTMKVAEVAEASTTIQYTFDSGQPSMYALSPAHDYSVNWIAYYSYNSMSSNKKAGEGSIKIIGDDENAAIISPTVEFESIDHDPDTFVFSDADGTIDHIDLKLTFKGEGNVASVEAWVQAAQMDTRPQQASISEDGKTVTVTVSTADVAGSGACAVFVRAKDADGHIIGAPGEAVNPNNGYLQFSYASEIGLPAPSLTNAAGTVEQITELVFVHTAGISLNMDASGSWSKIQIVDNQGNIIETGFKEEQFVGTGGGNESYTTMTLTLSNPIVTAGQYAVILPYAAFVLGQQQSAHLNGSKTYTITVDESSATGIDIVKRAIINGEKTYTISGQPVKTAKAGVYIINGKKVAVK